mgnify:CR=1 FL=1
MTKVWLKCVDVLCLYAFDNAEDEEAEEKKTWEPTR